MYGILSQIGALFSLKNAWLPHIFFLDTSGTYKDLLCTDSFKPCKNITVFESITDRKTRVSRDAQNVCAITIVGTALKKGLVSCDNKAAISLNGLVSKETMVENTDHHKMKNILLVS